MPFSLTTTRSYGTARGWRIAIFGLGPPLLLGFLWVPFVLDDSISGWGRVYLTALMEILVLGIGLGMWEVYRARHIFSEAGIRYQGAFRSKELPLAAIKGYRIDDNYTHIVPVSKQYPSIRIGYSSEGYTEIRQWLAARFPDLDVQQQEQETEVFLQEEDFGRNPAEREANLAHARQVSWLLNAAGWLTGAWLLFWPEPYDWAMLASLALPPLAAAALFWHHGLLCFDDSSSSARPSVTAALLFPPLGLLIRALLDFELLAYEPLAPYAAGTSLLLATALVLGSPQLLATSSRHVLITGGVIALLYGAAAAVAVNCAFDAGIPRVYAVPVLGKHFSSGKTDTYYLNVGLWGTRAQPDDVEVSEDLYEQTAAGDTAYIYQFPGRLGATWFTTGG